MLFSFLNKNRQTRGLTLIEIMVSMGVFTIVSMGILAVVLQIRRMAENNVYENTALTMAQGYLEQVRSLPYGQLLAAANFVGTPPTPDLGVGRLNLLSANGGGATFLLNESNQLLRSTQWTNERVFLDRDAAGRNLQPMDFRFRVSLLNIDNPALVAIRPQGIEIILDYQFTFPDGRQRVVTRSIRNVRSVVPTF